MSSIKKEMVKGVFWIAVAKYSGIVVQLFITAILARLIPPTTFGTIAVAMVVLYFLNIFSDIGIGPAVVQYKQLNKFHLNNLFTLTIYIGLLLALMLFGLSNFIADYYDEVILGRVCKIMSLIIFFNTVNVIPNALMRKDKRFPTIAIRTLFFLFVSGSIAICGALSGWGIYALLIPPVVTAIGVFFVNYYNYPLSFTLKININTIKIVASFSFFQFAFSFLNYFSRNLDKLIIGKFFSLTQLGYYDKSYHLMMLPVQNVSFVIEPVLHPILSSLQNDKHELAEKNIKLGRTISNLSFPIGVLLFFCGGEMIQIVYGDKWDAAIPVFQILALSLPLQMIQSTSGAIYQAAGKTKHMFMNGIFNTLVTVSGFIIAAFRFGTIESIAWSWVITLLINFMNSYYILNHFSLNVSSCKFLISLLPQTMNSLVTFVLATVLTKAIEFENIFISLIVKSAFILFVTLIIAGALGQYNLLTIIKDVWNRKKLHFTS